jgi:sulfatase modifying factor 1
VADLSAKHLLNWSRPDYDDGAIRTAPVVSYEANPWGLYDIVGNVAEWTADWYDENYYSKSVKHNPQGPLSGQYRVFRGGSWNDRLEKTRSAVRNWGITTERRANIGFRCAQDVPK